jgi:hypothetical protein
MGGRRVSSSHTVRIPDFVTHYHLPDCAPFLNLSTLAEDELPVVLAELERLRALGTHQRVFGSRYMDLRRHAEELLRKLFVEAGGAPQRTAPHYFVLGRSEWYEGLASGMQSVTLAMTQLPPDQSTFTYPDSFTAMGTVSAFGLPYERRPYHGRVFRLHELPRVVQRYGLPDGGPASGYAGYERRTFEKYIEVQLWTDDPIQRYLGLPGRAEQR